MERTTCADCASSAVQGSGFTIDQIAELDACDDRERSRNLAAERIAALDGQIAHLQSMRAALDRLTKACRDGTMSDPRRL